MDVLKLQPPVFSKTCTDTIDKGTSPSVNFTSRQFLSRSTTAKASVLQSRSPIFRCGNMTLGECFPSECRPRPVLLAARAQRTLLAVRSRRANQSREECALAVTDHCEWQTPNTSSISTIDFLILDITKFSEEGTLICWCNCQRVTTEAFHDSHGSLLFRSAMKFSTSGQPLDLVLRKRRPSITHKKSSCLQAMANKSRTTQRTNSNTSLNNMPDRCPCDRKKTDAGRGAGSS